MPGCEAPCAVGERVSAIICYLAIMLCYSQPVDRRNTHRFEGLVVRLHVSRAACRTHRTRDTARSVSRLTHSHSTRQTCNIVQTRWPDSALPHYPHGASSSGTESSDASSTVTHHVTHTQSHSYSILTCTLTHTARHTQSYSNHGLNHSSAQQPSACALPRSVEFQSTLALVDS